MNDTRHPPRLNIAVVAILTAAFVAVGWVIVRFSHTDIDDPVTVTAIRLNRLETAVALLGERAATFDDLLNVLPSEEREELRLDGWGREIRYSVRVGMYELRSSGPDGIFENADDFHVTGQFPEH